MIRKQVFDHVKKMIPRISDTEMIALQCGTTSLDRQILEGKIEDLINPLITEEESKKLANIKNE